MGSVPVVKISPNSPVLQQRGRKYLRESKLSLQGEGQSASNPFGTDGSALICLALLSSTAN